jgi:hypothetical protein
MLSRIKKLFCSALHRMARSPLPPPPDRKQELFRPRLESLEAREVPANTWIYSSANDGWMNVATNAIGNPVTGDTIELGSSYTSQNGTTSSKGVCPNFYNSGNNSEGVSQNPVGSDLCQFAPGAIYVDTSYSGTIYNLWAIAPNIVQMQAGSIQTYYTFPLGPNGEPPGQSIPRNITVPSGASWTFGGASSSVDLQSNYGYSGVFEVQNGATVNLNNVTENVQIGGNTYGYQLQVDSGGTLNVSNLTTAQNNQTLPITANGTVIFSSGSYTGYQSSGGAYCWGGINVGDTGNVQFNGNYSINTYILNQGGTVTISGGTLTDSGFYNALSGMAGYQDGANGSELILAGATFSETDTNALVVYGISTSYYESGVYIAAGNSTISDRTASQTALSMWGGASPNIEYLGFSSTTAPASLTINGNVSLTNVGFLMQLFYNGTSTSVDTTTINGNVTLQPNGSNTDGCFVNPNGNQCAYGPLTFITVNGTLTGDFFVYSMISGSGTTFNGWSTSEGQTTQSISGVA